MDVTRNPDGTLTVPMRVEGPDGLIGDGMTTIGPDDPEYAAWDTWLKRWEREDSEPHRV